jgi:uncharacterized protein YbjT (DUF2867 family)
MPAITPADAVAVTGAGGFLGSHLVQHLLAHGYSVHACVRDAADAAKTRHLLAMGPGVELFGCDLLAPGAYDEAFRGCTAVFHVAAALGRHGLSAQARRGRTALCSLLESEL